MEALSSSNRGQDVMSTTMTWQLLCQGAESRLWTGRAFDDRSVVKKERFVKRYRHRELDDRLTRERMRAEVRAIVRLIDRCPTLGPRMPTIWLASDRELIMDRVSNAVTVTEYTIDRPLSDCRWLYEQIGLVVACVHSAGLVHGDLTTSNFLLRPDRTVVPIDFGLASFTESDEDRAVDLYVLERSLLASHVQHAAGFDFVLIAYASTLRPTSAGALVLRKLKEVQLRGRKRSMVG